MKIKKCVVCGKDFAPLVGNQIKCQVCRNSKVRKTEVHQIQCAVCGKTFSSSLYNKKYCSRKCREAFHYSPIPKEKTCRCCEKKFTTTKANRKYCSDYCSLMAKTGKLDYLKGMENEQPAED